MTLGHSTSSTPEGSHQFPNHPTENQVCMNFVGTPLQCSQCIIIPLKASLTLKTLLLGGKCFPHRPTWPFCLPLPLS